MAFDCIRQENRTDPSFSLSADESTTTMTSDFSALRDTWLTSEDAVLISQIEWDFHKGSGNGGQKVNKTSSAVRLRHIPSQIVVICRDSRSQTRNRQIALSKLRKRIALEVRCPAMPITLPPQIPSLTGKGYPLFLAHILDAVRETGKAEGITRSALDRFLRRDEEVWRYIAEHRTTDYALYFNINAAHNQN